MSSLLPGETSPYARKGDTERWSEESAEAVVTEAEAGRTKRSPGAGRFQPREGPNGRKSEASVSLKTGKRPTARQLELPLQETGEACLTRRSGETAKTAHDNERSGSNHLLMEEVVERRNMQEALRRVRKNKGSPGIDGIAVDELPLYLAERWPEVREQLLAGTYQPMPVKRQQIPKSGGGMRELGIPTTLDRVIQQAILQVLQPRLDPTFSEHSYGFRPKRSAHHAVKAAQRYVAEGKTWVVDVDLEKFFDRVNHDVLMGRLAKRVEDKRMLRVIRQYLGAGIMVSGVVMERHEGTPQGGPLSPLLANVLLDEVDKELEARGHAFCRYADDCNVYVRSERAGRRVMQHLTRRLARLHLRVNEEKSAVARPWDRKFLGFTLTVDASGTVRRTIAPQALTALKDRVREMTRIVGGRSIAAMVGDMRGYLVGWKAYFQLAENAPYVLQSIDAWIRRRLRACVIAQWKTARTAYTRLRALGLDPRSARAGAAHCHHRWACSRHAPIQRALPNRYFDQIGLPRLVPPG